VPVQVGNSHPTSAPMGLFEASDGHFNLGASGNGSWIRLCNLLGKPEWINDPELSTEKLRVKNRERCDAIINEIFRTRPVAYWVDALNEAGVPAGPVYTIPQMFDDVQIKHLGVVKSVESAQGPMRHFLTQPVALSRTPADVVRTAPGWGEHTDEILKGVGYDEAGIAALREQGVV